MKKKFTRRDFVKAGTLGSGAAILAACVPQVVKETVAPAPTTAPAVVKAGATGRVIYGQAEPPTSAQWDDQTVFGLVDFQVGSLVHDRLWESDETGKLQPRLATAWKYTDEKTLEITLRKGVKYQDGSAFDAEDVKATIDRVSSDTKVAHNLFWAPVKTTIVDPYTVKISGDVPFGPLVPVLAGTSIQPKEWVGQADKWKAGNIGCGPYNFVSYENNTVTLEAWDGYWDGSPGIKTVVFNYIEDWNARTNALLAGDVDIITRCSSEQLDAVKGNDKFYLVDNSPAISVCYIYGREKNKASQNKKFRQALWYAIDRNTILTKIMQGVGKYADSPIPTKSLFYEPMKEKYDYNPAKAKQLLADSGLASSDLKMTMATSTLVPHQKEIDLQTIQYLSDVGIKIEVTTLEVGQFRTDWPQYDISLNTNGTPNGDPDFLLAFFSAKTGILGAGNDTAAKGEEVVKLFDTQRQQTDPAKRQAAVTANCEWLWDYQSAGVVSDELWPFIVNKRVQGYRRQATFSEPLLRYAKVT